MVGIVNAKLMGPQVFRIGFAVPVKYAKSLLKKYNVAFATAGKLPNVDGPTLAKRAVPSVALVAVMSGSDRSELTDQGQPSLYYHAVLDRTRRPRAADNAVDTHVDASERDDGRLILNDRGEIARFKPLILLPCLLGPSATVVIDVLPPPGKKDMEPSRHHIGFRLGPGFAHPLYEIQPPNFAVRPVLPPLPFGPFFRGFNEDLSEPASFQTDYAMDEPTGTTVVIRKRLAIKTLDENVEKATLPQMELAGKGETVFDLSVGVPQKVTFSESSLCAAAANLLEVPGRWKCVRIVDAQTPVAKSARLEPADFASKKTPPRSATDKAANERLTHCWPLSAPAIATGASAPVPWRSSP